MVRSMLRCWCSWVSCASSSSGDLAVPGSPPRFLLDRDHVDAREGAPEAGAVVVDQVVVDPEQDRVQVARVRARQRQPVHLPVLEQLQQVRARVGDQLAAAVLHPVARDPGRPRLLPEARRGGAERGVRERVAAVLRAADRRQRVRGRASGRAPRRGRQPGTRPRRGTAARRRDRPVRRSRAARSSSFCQCGIFSASTGSSKRSAYAAASPSR